jgi:lipopolysaccharide export system permease protein
MRTLDRHLAGLFLRNLALIAGVLVGLYGLIEFLERVDDFIENQAALTYYLSYPLYKLPAMVIQTLPMALMLAAFTTIGQLSRTHQITALRSSGVSFWQTTRPLFVIGALFSLIVLAGNSWLAPWSTREASYILDTEIKGKSTRGQEHADLYIRDGQHILRVAHSFPQKGELQGVMLLDLDLHFNLTRRVEAISAHYEGNDTWRLQTVTERRFDPEQHNLTGVSRHNQLLVDLGRGPQELTEIWSDPRELTVPELLQIGAQMQRNGQDPRRYQNELQFRMAQSLMPLLVILIGVPFALQRGRQATLGAGVALSLGVFGVYLLLQAVGTALGTVGLLPLPLAAWSANLLLLLLGGWLFLSTDY